MSLLQSFGNLSAPVKISMGVFGCAGLMSIVAVAMNPGVLLVVGIGLVMLIVVLLLYMLFLRWMKKRRAQPFESQLAQNANATPMSISGAAERARVDELRQAFEEGISKFREAGKDLYSTPWYALVGEPGSGKTEAIRHCNVGFPPGLQDQLQGAGGTLNMNWWFTNHAVIIDTAGRLMFEETPAGQTSEWNEFLKMLRNARPNCPINGLLLVIPADSLIKDTADEIEHKAGRIAQQFDAIQRQLGVRFPVFVVITKCDLINGFREFFDDLIDPDLQHQMLGWSNPGSLDDPFEPAKVEEHLATVRERLIARRTTMLLDPIAREKDNRRIDEVDALYAFSESFMAIVPRLRRYLEMVFVPGEWSAKPLFLRGIYFNSSMREGSALDSELADVLGVSVESLPEGRVWETDRAYFLRDLFLKKVFKEKGLVTRASNTRAMKRRRRAVLMGTGMLGAAALLAFTWFGSSALNSSINRPTQFWADVAKEFVNEDGTSKQSIIERNKNDASYKYVGSTRVTLGGKEYKLVELPGLLKERADDSMEVPLIFRPVAGLKGDLMRSDRQKAMRSVVGAVYLAPLVAASREKLGSENQRWSPLAGEALRQLVSLEVAWARKNGSIKTDAKMIRIDPLMRFVLESGKTQGPVYPKEHGHLLQDALTKAFPDANDASWPPDSLQAGSASAKGIIEDASAKFEAAYSDPTPIRGTRLSYIEAVKRAISRLDDVEKPLLDLSRRAKETRTLQNDVSLRTDWQDRFETARERKESLDNRISELSEDEANMDLRDAFAQANERWLNECVKMVRALENELPPADAQKDDTEGAARHLFDLRNRLSSIQMAADATKEQRAKGEKTYDVYDTQFFSKAGGDQRPYLRRFEMYEAAYKQLNATDAGDPDPAKFDEDLQKIRQDHADAIIYINERAKASDQQTKDAKAVALMGVDIAKRLGSEELIRSALNQVIADFRRYPLCVTKDRSDPMSPQEVKAAFARVRSVAGALKDLKSPEILADHQQWFDQLIELASIFESEDPMTCQIVIQPFKQQEDNPPESLKNSNLKYYTSMYTKKYLSLLYAGKPIGEKWYNTQAPESIEVKSEGLPVPTMKEADRLSLMFYNFPPDSKLKDNPPIKLDLNTTKWWWAIDSIHHKDAKYDKATETWLIPVVFTYQKTQLFYWIGLKFNRPLPSASSWPTESQWPKSLPKVKP